MKERNIVFETETEKIHERKLNNITELNRTNAHLLSCVYGGIMQNKSLRDIHRDIKTILQIKIKNGIPISKKQEALALKVAKNAKSEVLSPTFAKELQKSDVKQDVFMAEFVIKMFEHKHFYQNMKKVSYEQANKEESNAKERMIFDVLKTNRDYNRQVARYEQEMKSRIFYLASAHDDCAKDHLKYQGKLYIDEKWKDFIKNKDLQDKISNFIAQKGIKTFQWVIGKPAWFITRPNCRHFFRAIPVEDVLKLPVGQLIRNYKLHRESGNYDLQTIYHSTRRNWYTLENINSIIKQYEDRLVYHEAMQRAFKSQYMADLIKKDKLLIKKWKDYLHSFKNGLK